jgi:hypothetical protein
MFHLPHHHKFYHPKIGLFVWVVKNEEAPHYMIFFSLSSLEPIRSKYSPRQPAIKHPQSVFFS